MPALENLKLFIVAAFVVNLIPGSDRLFVTTVSVRQGISAGIVSSFGIAFATFIHSLMAAFGLLIIFNLWPWFFVLIRLVGILFLIFLGITIVLKNRTTVSIDSISSPFNLFFQAMMVHFLNPIAAIFVLTFIPQFIEPGRNFALQFILLSALSNFMGIIMNMTNSLLFSQVERRFKENNKFRKALNYICGSALILVALSQLWVWFYQDG